ncbi:MAG: hypothetical protein IPK16_16885 [Anaerolineales bacterium]|nr:hypothetical protein [Anaerolineales bacterium]
MIKTAILCIPIYDEQASAAVRRLLHNGAPGCTVLLEQNAPMQRYVVEDLLRRWSDDEEMDLVLTIGGTLPAPGPSGREVVPEATLAVAERQLPGISEAMRAHAAVRTPLAWLDRGLLLASLREIFFLPSLRLGGEALL